MQIMRCGGIPTISENKLNLYNWRLQDLAKRTKRLDFEKYSVNI
jgi:hypothetical protein